VRGSPQTPRHPVTQSLGDVVGLPPSQLVVLPGTTHVTLVDRTDWLLSMIAPFLDALTPESKRLAFRTLSRRPAQLVSATSRLICRACVST
jgi:hypothetical protein